MIFADQLMYMGFRFATRAAVSFCSNDMVVPEEKTKILGQAEAEVKEIENQYTSRFGDQWRALQQGGRYLVPYQ